MTSKKLLSFALFPISIGLLFFTTEKNVVHKSSEKQKIISQDTSNGNPLRDVFYGDLHLHTAFSFDAYVMMGTRATPDEAYRYAKGEPINLNGQTLQKSQPLDFTAVTDHSENIGLFQTLDDGGSELSKSDFGKHLRDSLQPSTGGKHDIGLILRLHDIKTISGVDVESVVKSQWQKEKDAANNNYQPGKFTTFIAYEWTSHTNMQNLHRNVIFRGDAPSKPFSSLDSDKPEDLWAALKNFRSEGYEALAISHNANVSNGLMYDWKDSRGKPIDEAYAQLRAINEPLSEISQSKGQSETRPELSPSDEFSNFEVVNYLLASAQVKSKIDGSYIRQAYGRGLELEKKVGTNPYKFGLVGATDIHTGITSTTEKEVKGVTFGNLEYGSGSLTGVWAEKNTRESIYDALRRKETFATSGPRLKFRFFAGWDFNKNIFNNNNWIKDAYSNGVPMGGDLPQKPAGTKAPQFLVWVIKDPNGANLDRAQVVKVWLTKEGYKEKVFDVALSDGRKPDANGKVKPVGNTVDVKTATYQNTIGDVELKTVWQDPEFDAAIPAVYYLRVIEIPTPRWTTILAVQNKTELPKDSPATLQERGWASPIWYTPTK